MNKVDMGDWIWNSDKNNCRLSTYQFYTFMSFDDVDGNDFITIQGKELGEYLALTIVREDFTPNKGLEDLFSSKPYRYKLICVGCKNLVTFARVMANKNCHLNNERDTAAVFIAPTAVIIEEVVSSIIQYLIGHHIEYGVEHNLRRLVD